MTQLPAIFDLNGPRGPSAVRRLVISVVVDAVKRQPFWAPTHVGHEILERKAPPIANTNASPAVVAIGLVGAIVAAAIHGAPRDVFGRDLADAGVSMRGIGETCPPNTFSVKASTALGRGAKCVGVNNGPVAAIAQAQPEHARPRVGSAFLDKQAAESLSGQFKRSHINYFTSLET